MNLDLFCFFALFMLRISARVKEQENLKIEKEGERGEW